MSQFATKGPGVRNNGASFLKSLLPSQKDRANRKVGLPIDSPGIPLQNVARDAVEHLLLPVFWTAFEALKRTMIIPCVQYAAHEQQRTIAHHMVWVMIFIVQDKQMMKLGLDLLNFITSQPVAFCKSLEVNGPLSFTKRFKKRAQGFGKSVPF